MKKESYLWQIFLPAVLCTALWGSAAPCVKTGYRLFAVEASAPFSQLVFAGWRFLLAGLVVLAATALRGKRSIKPQRRDYKAIAWICLFQSILQYICYYIGLAGTTGVKGSVLSGTQTFFAIVLAHLLLSNDKLTRPKALGCLLGFAGVVVLNLRGGIGGFGRGDLLVLLSAVSSGAGALVSRIYTPGRDPMLLTGWQLTIGGGLLLTLGTAGGGRLGAVTLPGVLLLAYLVVLSAVAFTVWTGLLGKFSVSRISIYGFCIPLFGALFSALILGEQLVSLRNLCALSLVCAGIAIANTQKKTPK